MMYSADIWQWRRSRFSSGWEDLETELVVKVFCNHSYLKNPIKRHNGNNHQEPVNPAINRCRGKNTSKTKIVIILPGLLKKNYLPPPILLHVSPTPTNAKSQCQVWSTLGMSYTSTLNVVTVVPRVYLRAFYYYMLVITSCKYPTQKLCLHDEKLFVVDPLIERLTRSLFT